MMISVPQDWALGNQNLKIDPNLCLPIILEWFMLKKEKEIFNLWLSDLVVIHTQTYLILKIMLYYK